MSAITTDIIVDWVRAHPLPNGRIIPVCLWGEAGVGKTAWLMQYCERRRFGYRIYQPAHDRTGADVVGMGYIDDQLKRTVHARPMWQPAENDPVIFERSGIVFIDELNRGTAAVLAGLMEPIGEGRVGQSGWVQPKQWSFVCTANPPERGYQVLKLDDALMNRMLHLPTGFDAVRWSAWAEDTKIDREFIAFTAQHGEELVARSELALPDTLLIEATPRSVEYLARMYEPDMDRDLLKVLAQGLIGKHATEVLLEHLNTSARPVTPDEVMNGAFTEQVIAHRTEGREDLLKASVTMMVAMMVRYSPSDPAAERVVEYLQMLGKDLAPYAWGRIARSAPHWVGPLHEAWRTRAAAELRGQTPAAP